MISVNQALSIIKRFKYNIGDEYISPDKAIGRIVSENILSKLIVLLLICQQWMDMLFLINLLNNIYKVVDEIYAGSPVNRKIKKNEAVEFSLEANYLQELNL